MSPKQIYKRDVMQLFSVEEEFKFQNVAQSIRPTVYKTEPWG